jgi:hypothetical protein
LGSNEGIDKRQEYKVLRQTRLVRDPSTGQILDASYSEIARIRIASVDSKSSWAVVTSGNYTQIMPGDLVRPTEYTIQMIKEEVKEQIKKEFKES